MAETIDRDIAMRAKGKRRPARSKTNVVLGASSARASACNRQASAALDAPRLAAIVEGSDDAIISNTLQGVVSSWNGGATRMLGYTAAEMIGHPIARVVPDDLQHEEVEILAKLARGEHVDPYDTVRLAKDGRRVAVSLTVSPLRDTVGRVVGASKIARDITRRKETEEALRRANEAAQRSRVEAENANDAKTEFLAVMSHEIRTPLNSINGFIDLLTNSTKLTPQQRRYADLVKTASLALQSIVDDILDFSKVEAGRMDLELRPFSSRALIRDTLAVVAPTVAAKRLELTLAIEPDVPEWILGDPGRLRQVLLNLLNNATKFTDEGSIKVDARLHFAADGRERILFRVTDTGVGVATERQHRLFRKFSQADGAVSQQYGGTGLGLAICRRLVELMDGEIGIVSEAGRGSTLWFTACLPRVRENAPEPASERAREAAAEGKARILVVDDVETNLEIARAYLEDYGLDCGVREQRAGSHSTARPRPVRSDSDGCADAHDGRRRRDPTDTGVA